MLSVFCCAVYYSLSVSLYSAAAARMRCATSFRRLSGASTSMLAPYFIIQRYSP